MDGRRVTCLDDACTGMGMYVAQGACRLNCYRILSRLLCSALVTIVKQIRRTVDEEGDFYDSTTLARFIAVQGSSLALFKGATATVRTDE
jgi:hypothetical protein